MLFRLFRSEEINGFVNELAIGFKRRVPPELLAAGGGRREEKKIREAVKELHLRLAKYKREKGLGFFNRARLGNALKWQLQEMGYPVAFVGPLVRDLLLSLTTAATQTPKQAP